MTGWEEWEGGGAGVKETEEGIWLEGKSRARLPLEPFSGTPSIPLVERLSISSTPELMAYQQIYGGGKRE